MSTAGQAPPAAGTGTPVSGFITLLIHVLAALLLLRVVLIFLGVNVEQPLVAAFIATTEPFASTFAGIFPQPSDEAGIIPLDVGAAVAAIALEGIGLLVRAVARRAVEIP